MNTTTQNNVKDEQTVVGALCLRDYFAAKAMQGFCMGHARLNDTFDPMIYPIFAQHSYLAADAMLCARNEKC